MKQVIFFFLFIATLPVLSLAQLPDTGIVKKDSVIKQLTATPATPAARNDSAIKNILQENNLLNSSGTPLSLGVELKKAKNNDTIFYGLVAMLLLLAFFRFFFPRYFTNLIRVFFNTSLRQSQLTDQLLQARLPSLLLNLFFIISGGMFIYFLLLHYNWVNEQNRWIIIGSCIGVLGLIYFLKFCILKFTGWVTGYHEETNTYIFIFFLINKIIGIFLVPFIILMAFADMAIVKVAVVISLIIIGFLVLLRFFRSYGLLQNQLKVSRFHFFLYILGIEILPLLLIYKGLVVLLNKNL